jgi:beta-lactamase superfamily II metal-dependent hydrolase
MGEGWKKYVGIIDSALANGQNKTLDYLNSNSIDEIEFIVLSHLHYDHFSGMADIFEHCIAKNIRVKYFYHSLHIFLYMFYDKFLLVKNCNGG